MTSSSVHQARLALGRRLREIRKDAGLTESLAERDSNSARVHNPFVDQGIAALLGATVGVLGTVSTSAISGWSSRQQIRAQARVDHAQWRRQARRDAYSAFLAPAHETRNVLKRVARALIDNAHVEQAGPQLQAAHDRLGEVQAAWAALAVEGPESVEQAANGVKTALHSMHTTLLAWHDSPEYPHNVKFVERLFRRVRHGPPQ